MMRWRLVGFLVVAMLIGTLVVRRDAPTALEELSRSPADAADLYMEAATVTQFGDDGSIRYRITAEEIRHFETDDTTRLKNPLLTVHRATSPPWQVSANRGDISYRTNDAGETREEIVLLQDAVVLERITSEGQLRLTTESLYVYPERQFAETDRAVMIESDAGRTHAAGLTGDLKSGVLELTSDESQRVHTIVLPNQFKPAAEA